MAKMTKNERLANNLDRARNLIKQHRLPEALTMLANLRAGLLPKKKKDEKVS